MSTTWYSFLDNLPAFDWTYHTYPIMPTTLTERLTATYTTQEALAATQATHCTNPVPPPIATWVSPGLLSFIDHSPAMPGLRGAIRAELDLRVPSPPILAQESDAIKAWLVDNFKLTRLYRNYWFQYYQGSITGRPSTSPPNLYPAPPTLAGHNQQALAQAPRPATAPAMRVDADGSLLLPGITSRGTERGTAQYVTTVTYTGALRIPADVLAEGREGINAFIRRHVAELEENTDNFVYDNWTPSNVELREVIYDHDSVDRALQPTAEQVAALAAIIEDE